MMPVLVALGLLALALAGCTGPSDLPLPGLDHPANPQAEAGTIPGESQSWYRNPSNPVPAPLPAPPLGGPQSGGHGHEM